MRQLADEITFQEIRNLIEEDLIEKAKAFYYIHQQDWAPAFSAYFKDIIECMVEQLDFEKYRVSRMKVILEMRG